MATLVPIPQPRPRPLLGNLPDVDPDLSILSFMDLARIHGPIFRLEMAGRSLIVVGSQALVNEVCDEKRFGKVIHSSLRELRAIGGDGLFTAHTEEPNWGKAHRILMPAFGPLGVREMFAPMLDVAEQMLLRWERFGAGTVLDVPDQMTRLTLDTIALCAFDYRFNSFYQNEMHPFVDAMVDGLKEAGARTRRPGVANRMLLLSARRYEEDIRLMHGVADQLIAERRRDPAAGPKNDLLGRMLSARDPVTGETLSDENIRYQMVTFLIAGHETTSGLLSFALHLLLKNPRVLHAARARVDEVLGTDTPRLDHLASLRYVEQILMETLRLWPTAPGFAVHPHEDTVLGGRYAVTAQDTVMIFPPTLHRDPTVWGADAEAFRPERFDRDAEARLPPNAWKPFGNGQRACIGRPFAMQEAQLVLSMILQRFDLFEDDPSYTLKIKQALTIKPDGFRIRVRRREPTALKSRSAPPATPRAPPRPESSPLPARTEGPRTRLLVLYGSNTGSAQAFAQRIGNDAPARGYAVEVAPMDDHAGRLPTEGAVLVLTASYEGQPPDNARQFVAALEAAPAGAFAGVKYAVFGCGNRQWARTYQAIPLKVDGLLEAAGAHRLKPRGEADASEDFFGAFDAWYATLWHELGAVLGTDSAGASAATPLQVEVVREGRSAILRQEDLGAGQLVENRELVDMAAPQARSKRHLELELPEGMTYRAGDYLAVLPRNPGVNVERAMRRFGFAPDAQVIVHKEGAHLTALPTGYPIAVSELLASYVELGQPATRAQVETLAKATRCPPEKLPLEALAREESYRREVLDKRVSVLELLERFPACALSFAGFLEMLPPLKARQYSIASSPLWNPTRCALTVAVVDAPAYSGQGRYLGVTSNYLAALAPPARVSVAVRPSQPRFHPPEDPQVPLVLICAGTGIAPFRGFLQERALQAREGRRVGPALLFFGCDHPEADFLYREELEAWQLAGVVDVRPAFTLAPEGEVTFVQHRVWKDRADVAELFRRGATVYVCGDGRRMAPAVRETLVRIYAEATGATREEAERWALQVEREHGRFVADVFA
ncbi:bifunctional cytochrome P450/NADPH--P450 reductase [Archangium primigenium]|uniref:bifunctional cytochrome P450/NADPH--P450 reductase n=1 Tax=[Archangium] primigenium TaxID=2792470 RepID=UPI0019595FA3|nr:cytochrome P450 [Archangium primigenium]MBM7117417.1 cytochrome P450 [Archangium primigenium]